MGDHFGTFPPISISIDGTTGGAEAQFWTPRGGKHFGGSQGCGTGPPPLGRPKPNTNRFQVRAPYHYPYPYPYPNLYPYHNPYPTGGTKGGRCSQKKVTGPASRAGPRFLTEFWPEFRPISRVPRTGPTTQTCSVNNFFVTSAFLNLNSSCESRERVKLPLSIFMIGASSMVKISSQDGPSGPRTTCELRVARRSGSSHSPLGPSCDDIFTMLEAPIIKIESLAEDRGPPLTPFSPTTAYVI